MSQDPVYTARAIDDDRAMHPLEEVLRLIGRDAPRPFFPAEFLARSRANPEQLSSILDHLALEGLIDKVPARSIESGSGVVLTKLGEQVLADPGMLARLVKGDALREGDVGAVIRQGMRTRVRPTFTYVLIAINVGIYLLGKVKPEWEPGGAAFDNWAARSDTVMEPGGWLRLMTCTFLHGGLMHVGCNMFSLYSVGSFVEQAWGRWRFLLIYLIAGWAGSCLGVQYAIDPRTGGPIPLVGASGAVCGLLAAVGAWFVLYRKYIPADFARRGLWQVALSIGLIAFLGFMIPFVSNYGHLGGGIGGAAAALVLHVQRFGLPGMSRRAAGLRWAIAVPLLLILPVASYLQMQRPWSGKGVVRKDEKSGKGGARKIEKPDPVEGAAFYKEFGEALTTRLRSARDNLYRMPDDPETIQNKKQAAQKAAAMMKEDQETLSELRGRLAKASYNDAGVEQLREDAIALIDDALEVLKLADKQLNDPTDARRRNLLERFNTFSGGFTNYVNKRLDPIAPKD